MLRGQEQQGATDDPGAGLRYAGGSTAVLHTPIEPTLLLSDVIPWLGFIPDRAGTSGSGVAMKLELPGLELTAVETLNRFFLPALQVAGLWRTDRSLRMIDFEMPMLVESREQAVAWLTFGIGLDCPAASALPWLAEGRTLQHLLPWVRRECEQSARRAELQRQRAARPHCIVSRHWMRVLLNQLADVAAATSGPFSFSAHFNGRMLTIDAGGRIMGAPASGPGEWPERVRAVLATGAPLPRRLMTDPVEVGVWDGALEIERSRLPLIPW